MTHLYTRGCEYAIRALQVLVTEPDRLMTVTEFCDRADIPEPFTRKMLQQLVRAGILDSRRGPGGGFTFAIDPNEISLMDVVVAIEGGPRTDQCVLGRHQCNDADPCPLHFDWAPIKAASIAMLETRTVSDLAKKPTKARGRR
ncbi:MAG: Rrf2 family transcriptional regulator [Planctomycetes bacterium]|nr:Rrf2 family transcriptional regulator [Planctomycetota bacterium]